MKRATDQGAADAVAPRESIPVPSSRGPRTWSKNPIFSWPAPAGAVPAGGKPQRARPGQDLIGTLFETMHELHFAPDYLEGIEFALGVAGFTVPCAAILMHVFDLNTRQFVLVRATGPAADSLLMHFTPSNDPVLEPVMRNRRARRIEHAASDPRFGAGRWSLLGVAPDAVLCVPVMQAGRYLGAIELVNPEGGGGFHETEAHALDYIAEQLADFLANRPIVLDADMVAPKS